MQCISVTFEVSKQLRSRLERALQLENIFHIVVTFEVLIPAKLMYVRYS